MNPSSRGDMMFRMPQNYPRRHKSTLLMTLVFLAIVASGYILFRSSAIIAGPALSLDEPADGSLIRANSVVIKGKTDAKSRVTVNNFEVFSDDKGRFSVDLPMQKGFHILDVRVKNRIGKETKIVHRIVVE